MRLKAEEFMKGGYYHIYNHAAQNMDLFRNEEDYRICLGLVRQYLRSADYSVIAFCLMPNHYHFLIRQNSESPVFQPMNMIWFRYAKYFNKKYQGKGSIFASKMQHIVVDKDEYLLRLIAYIHMNPVTAGLVDKLQDWEWSNYPEWIGLRDTGLVDKITRDELYSSVSNYEEIIEKMTEDIKMRKYLLD